VRDAVSDRVHRLRARDCPASTGSESGLPLTIAARTEIIGTLWIVHWRTRHSPYADAATIFEFVHSRIDEDETGASAATGRPLPVSPAHDLAFVDGHDRPIRIIDGALAHIARHDPARVLAEVEAKRAFLELTAATLRSGQPVGVIVAGHPDYRAEEWAP
jgi:hypothetical protein